jgi:hypothetical protein
MFDFNESPLNFELSLRLAAIHRISTEGYWTVPCSYELFWTNPLDCVILWHNEQSAAKSDSLLLAKLNEIVATLA